MYLTGLTRGTNTPGQFEIPALPPGRKYGLVVSAPGCGQKMLNNVNASAEAGRMELDPFELKPANLKLAGQVLDADDKPVAGVNVILNGEGQPNGNTRTDREGRFRFEHVCEGTARLQANNQNSFGNISAEGGDTNVVLRLGQTYANNPGSTTHKLKGTVTDADGKPAAGAHVAVFPADNFALDKDRNQWRVQPHLVTPAVANAVRRRRAAGGPRPRPQSGRHRRVAGGHHQPGREIETGPDRDRAGEKCGRLSPGRRGSRSMAQGGQQLQQLDEQKHTSDARGRYEIKCLPADASYMVFASAKGHGRSQRQFEGDSETNRLELPPFVLKLADRVLAGQLLDDNDKPVSGAYDVVERPGPAGRQRDHRRQGPVSLSSLRRTCSALRQFAPRRRGRASQRRGGRHQRRDELEIADDQSHAATRPAPRSQAVRCPIWRG